LNLKLENLLEARKFISGTELAGYC